MAESGRKQQTKNAKEMKQMSFIYFARANWEIRQQLEYKGFKVGDIERLKEERNEERMMWLVKNGWGGWRAAVTLNAFWLKRLIPKFPFPEWGCKGAGLITDFFCQPVKMTHVQTYAVSQWQHHLLKSEKKANPLFCLSLLMVGKRNWKDNKNVSLAAPFMTERPKWRCWSETAAVLKENRSVVHN